MLGLQQKLLGLNPSSWVYAPLRDPLLILIESIQEVFAVQESRKHLVKTSLSIYLCCR